MRRQLQSLPRSGARLASTARCSSSFALYPYGRAAAYRRIHDGSHDDSLRISPSISTPALTLILRSPFCALQPPSASLSSRSFTSSTLRSQQQQPPKEEVRDPPRESGAENTSSDGSSAKSSDSSADETGSSGSKSDSSSQDESKNESKKEENKKEPPPPPPPHGDKSPWQVFTETLQTEFQKSKEWNESTKALGSFADNESVKRARAAYSSASSAATSTTSSAIKGTGKVLGQGAAWTWDTSVVKGVRTGVNATASGLEKATRPVRETKVYKTAVGGVKDVIDDGSSSRYGGWVEKEERRKQRELRELNEAAAAARGEPGAQPAEKMEEDPNAGTNVTLHKDSKLRESWNTFRDSSPLMQRLFTMRANYHESENPLISTARSITDRVAGFFAENETATVIKRFREMDPSFQVEPFLREMREWILPEVLDAYVKGDTDTLKLWLSAAQFQVYAALAQQYTTAGLKSDGRILDIRHVDILSARMLEPGEVPVFIITCRTQEVHVYRNAKTNQLAAGMEDRVQLVTYAIGVTRTPEDVGNKDTRGWRLIELQKSARDYI